MTLHVFDDVQQGSDEWHDQRRGIVTASVVGRLITIGSPDALSVDCEKCSAVAGHPCLSVAAKKAPTPIKTIHDARSALAADLPPVYSVANNDTSRALTAALVAERIAGWTDPSFVNDDMMRGIMHEPIARDRYADHSGVTVEQVGFLVRDDWGFRIGASPDGLVGEDGGLEVKCPRAKSHIQTIVSGDVPAYYMAQVQASLLVSGRQWWDFVSFCAGLPMWTKRVEPDPRWQEVIVDAVATFEHKAAELVPDYEAKCSGLPTTERIPDDIGLVF